MSEGLKKRVSETVHVDELDYKDLMQRYNERYQHKSLQEKKQDILLHALIIAAIEKFSPNVPVSIQRIAEITFSEIEDIQEHLPLILESHPEFGIYYEKEQTFVRAAFED